MPWSSSLKFPWPKQVARPRSEYWGTSFNILFKIRFKNTFLWLHQDSGADGMLLATYEKKQWLRTIFTPKSGHSTECEVFNFLKQGCYRLICFYLIFTFKDFYTWKLLFIYTSKTRKLHCKFIVFYCFWITRQKLITSSGIESFLSFYCSNSEKSTNSDQ